MYHCHALYKAEGKTFERLSSATQWRKVEQKTRPQICTYFKTVPTYSDKGKEERFIQEHFKSPCI